MSAKQHIFAFAVSLTSAKREAMGWLCVLVILCLPQLSMAQRSVEQHLPLDGKIAADGSQVTLSWFDAVPRRVGSVSVARRWLGDKGGDTWHAIATDLGPVAQFTDTKTRSGVAYEYRVTRSARDIVDVGYWTTGVDVPAVASHGTALVVVDETVAADLRPWLERFQVDLVGDGWTVARLDAPRGDLSAPMDNLERAGLVRAWIREAYAQNPFETHAVILIGHVPIVLSGRVAPDGHDREPHATDLFYADTSRPWPADPSGRLLPTFIPGQPIEMQVGRIDFSGLAQGDRGTELRHLRAYFDKNHHWRHGLLGDRRTAYGQNQHVRGERMALRNIVGPGQVASGGHHDVGETGAWLWGVDFGDANRRTYSAYRNRAAFCLLYTSPSPRDS